MVCYVIMYFIDIYVIILIYICCFIDNILKIIILKYNVYNIGEGLILIKKIICILIYFF